MLKRVAPIQFDRIATSGRTKPLFITCEFSDGMPLEVVAKFSANCLEANFSLAKEAIGACLARDLGLPAPEPYLVDVSSQWIDALGDPRLRDSLRGSSSVAFGSRVVSGQFGVWGSGNAISDIMLPIAAGIFVFDAIIQNPDRRVDNPNCLVRSDEIRIFDHELAFSQGLVIGWKPPWTLGGLQDMATNGKHIFRAGLKGRKIDFGPIRAGWASLSDARVAEYESALPPEWADARAGVAAATKILKDARNNIDACLDEVKRVLS